MTALETTVSYQTSGNRQNISFSHRQIKVSDVILANMNIKVNVAKFLVKIGISANFLTILGVLTAAASGWLASQGKFIPAGALLLFAGILDLLDGAVARESGVAKPFGGILDSTLDRYGDAMALGGVLFFCLGAGKILYAILCFSALIGSFAISYVRARAECEMDTCRVGFWERGERLVFLSVGLLLNNLAPVLWLLALGTHWTAFQRLWFARQPKAISGSPRSTTAYYVKIGILIGLLLFFRTGF
jgi:CDP-diacylglycerol--glycerol-3-phosphate 3-phosphatidyltransferase